MTNTVLSDGRQAERGSGLEFLRTTFRHHSWFLSYATAYIVVVVAALIAIDRPFRIIDQLSLLAALVLTGFAITCVVTGQTLFHLLHVRPLNFRLMLRGLRNDEKLRPLRLVYAAIPLFTFIAFQSAYTSFKSAIPFIQPFAYDEAFMMLDRWLHFGAHPWELLQPVLGYPIITSMISFAYKLWVGIFHVVFFYMAFSMRDPELRMQYLLSYLLTWSLIGSLGALLLSSAGPCYYGNVVGGGDPYAPLLAYLSAASEQYKNWSLAIQDYLWQLHVQEQLNYVSGISAMPSMHVAVATLQALLGWKINRRVGVLLTLFCALVVIGSIHLGWHYAIDGYVSILATIAIWKVVGYTLRRQARFSPITNAKAESPT